MTEIRFTFASARTISALSQSFTRRPASLTTRTLSFAFTFLSTNLMCNSGSGSASIAVACGGLTRVRKQDDDTGLHIAASKAQDIFANKAVFSRQPVLASNFGYHEL